MRIHKCILCLHQRDMHPQLPAGLPPPPRPLAIRAPAPAIPATEQRIQPGILLDPALLVNVGLYPCLCGASPVERPIPVGIPRLGLRRSKSRVVQRDGSLGGKRTRLTGHLQPGGLYFGPAVGLAGDPPVSVPSSFSSALAPGGQSTGSRCTSQHMHLSNACPAPS